MDDDHLVLDRVESVATHCAGAPLLAECDALETALADGVADGVAVAVLDGGAEAAADADSEAVTDAVATEPHADGDSPRPADVAAAELPALCAGEPGEAPESRAAHEAAAPSAAQIVEALLFSADTPLTLNRLSELAGCSPLEARLAMADLNDRYVAARLSFRIEQIARGYQMMTLPQFQPWLAKLNAQRSQTRLSPAALETVSIIAYKQPIIRADIEAIRGVACGEVLNRLREMGLVCIVGRAEVVGRPLLYGTSRKFLDVFGLADLDDLPPLEALNLRRRTLKAEEPAADPAAEPALAASA